MANSLKTIYRHLSRFPRAERLREAYRQKIQLHYWPCYRRKPTASGIEPDASRYKHELIVFLTSFPDRIRLDSFGVYFPLRQYLNPDCCVLWFSNERFLAKKNDLSAGLLDLKSPGAGNHNIQRVVRRMKLHHRSHGPRLGPFCRLMLGRSKRK